MKKHFCICARQLTRQGVFYSCAFCRLEYVENKAGLVLVKIAGEKPTPTAAGLEWFAKIRAAL